MVLKGLEQKGWSKRLVQTGTAKYRQKQVCASVCARLSVRAVVAEASAATKSATDHRNFVPFNCPSFPVCVWLVRTERKKSSQFAADSAVGPNLSAVERT